VNAAAWNENFHGGVCNFRSYSEGDHSCIATSVSDAAGVPGGALMKAASAAKDGVATQAKVLILRTDEGFRTEANMGAVMARKTTAA
jgi:hypothetical protein